MTDTRFSSLLEAVNGGNEMNRASKKRIGFIKTTNDISLDSQISLLRPADSLSILDL